LIREQWICAAQLDAGSNEGKIFLAASVDIHDIKDSAKQIQMVKWDKDRDMIVSVSEKRIGALLLESRPSSAVISDEERCQIIIELIREEGLTIVGDQEARGGLQARMLSMHYWRKEEAWPPVSDHYLIDNLEYWLKPFLSSINRLSELKKLSVTDALLGILPWDLQSRLDRFAPERLNVPSGSNLKLTYFSNGDSPVLEVRLQEMFGMTDTPTVNEGRTKVTLHLLSPGFKPVQVTQDLRSFWRTTYHEVRKELRMRYPRHHWPEDPWTAEAVRGAKRRKA
jgi:ATP-dependent helicase HrpB